MVEVQFVQELSCLESSEATASCTGKVGCRVFSQKYSLTGTPQAATVVFCSEVPL